MKSEILKKNKLPDAPGVYFFKHGRDVLYIGKATSLRDRVKSYFGKDLIETRGPLLVDMVFQADKIDHQTTDSVLEAIILEANLIKKHQPKYNTKEKSDKSFLSVVITNEKLPRVFTVRTRNLKEHSYILENVRISKIYGPFTNSVQLREAMKIIRPIFPFLDDKSKNYYKFYKQVYLVPDISTAEGVRQYKNNIKNLKLFFEGKKNQVLKNLEKEMKEYAKEHAFEKAGEVKKRIFALKHINDIALIKESYTHINFSPLRPSSGALRGPKWDPRGQKIHMGYASRIEAYDIAHMGGKNMVGVMTVVENGEVVKNEYKKFKIRTQSGANDTGALAEILERRLAHTEWVYPSLIVVDGGTAQLNIGKKVLKNLNLDIPIVAVLKDERHKPKDILGDKKMALKYEREILLANSEAHRFAIIYHKKIRAKNFFK